MISFIVTNILLGIGLAMDAFSVSIANGLRENKMETGRKCLIAGCYAMFQIVMPMIGWILVRGALEALKMLQTAVPYIALVLLVFIGVKMMIEGIKNYGEERADKPPVGNAELLMQGAATSIDALSVGFTFAMYETLYVLPAALIIGAVTFVICLTGLAIGRTVGMKFTRYSDIAGGVILTAVGIGIFIRGRYGI